MAAHRSLDPVIRKDNLDLDLGQEIHLVFASPVNFRVALLPAKPLTSLTVMPSIPISLNASLTSSNLKGFIIASIFFIFFAPTLNEPN